MKQREDRALCPGGFIQHIKVHLHWQFPYPGRRSSLVRWLWTIALRASAMLRLGADPWPQLAADFTPPARLRPYPGFFVLCRHIHPRTRFG
jgi:hypothetical protein